MGKHTNRAAVASLFLLAAVATSCSSDGTSDTASYPVERLRRVGVRLAAGYGDPHPTKIEAVRTDRAHAIRIIGGTPATGRGAVWLVQATGDFTCNFCPPGQPANPPVRFAATVINVGDGVRQAQVQRQEPVDLASLGRVVDIT